MQFGHISSEKGGPSSPTKRDTVADRESYRIVNKDLMFKVANFSGGVSIERTMSDFRKLEKAL
jgi:hypothetical protein